MAINTVINTNMMALTAHRNLGNVGNRQNKANQRLSSGKKINSAADDAAGLAISEKMKAQIRGLDMASKNSEDAISLIQTAEGSLTEVNNMLTRIRELTVQAGNDTNQQGDRVKIAEEVASLLTEIDSISQRTEFNEKKLNDGSFQDGHFQIGANSGQKLDLSIGSMSVFGIGMDEVMDAFGLEKSVDLNPTSSQVGVVGAGEKTSVKVAIPQVKLAANNNDKLTTGTIDITAKVNGVDQKLSFDIDLSSVTAAGQNITSASLASGIASGLNNNTSFSEKFIATVEQGNLTITTKDNGGDIIFNKAGAGADGGIQITLGKDSTGADVQKSDGAAFNNSDASKLNTNTADNKKGHYGTIDVTNLGEGESVTIGGKTYTKTAAGKEGEVYGGFSDTAGLQKLLQEDGVVTSRLDNTGAESGTGNVLRLDYATQDSRLAGEYKVNEKNVSDKGADFSKLLSNIDDSLNHVTKQRAKLGANQNRLEYTIKNLQLSSENLNAARSRIEDTDMAKEMMNLTQANVLQQAATSILAQANQAPNNITQLLG